MIVFEPMAIPEVASSMTPVVIGYGIYAMMKANKERAVVSDRINEALANSNTALARAMARMDNSDAVLAKAIDRLDRTMARMDNSDAVLAKAIEGLDKTMEGLDKSNAALAKVLEGL